MNLESLFEEIEENLPTSRELYIKHNFEEDESFLRSLDESILILRSLKNMAISFQALLKEYPSLESLFDKQYGKFSYFCSRDNIVDTCLVEDYLFPESEEYPLVVESLVDPELVKGYEQSFLDWIEVIRKNHQEAQVILFDKFDLALKQSDICCHCNKCLGDYRTKVREFIFNEQIEYINGEIEKLNDLVVEAKLSVVSDRVSKIKKTVERNLGKVRYKLKRGTLNKLDKEIKSHYKLLLGPQSDIGKVYKHRLISFFNGIIADQGHSPDLITESEYERFFSQLGIGIWKPTKTLEREFEKLIQSVLSFKRKDISATILKDYLGQFWVHSEARRKKRRVIYHMGPTNSGKTYNAIEALSKSQHGCYLAPLRLLASELYDTLNDKGCKTTLLTGEEVIEVEGATHYSSTIEMAKLHEEFDCVVIDEIQMITDSQRGWAWTRALVNVNADEIHICGDHSVFELVKQILDLTGDTLEVQNYERKTKLTVMKQPLKLIELEKNDTVIVFSRRNALKFKRDLERLGFKVSIVYGRLSPEVRREQARKFDEGETDIMVATDAIAMGMNLPVKRIVFSAIAKFFDGKEFPLTNSELKQIAGRAGRFQRFPEGFVSCLPSVDDGLESIEAALNHDLKQKELAMVGPDLEIFRSVNHALEESNLKTLSLSEFLRLFNTMSFEKPFYCVDLKEMIELAETVESADTMDSLSDAEIFGFACAPVNQGLMEHVQYYVWILNHYVGKKMILNEDIDTASEDIDYLETAIKCVELYQWLARHFSNNFFSFDQKELLENKTVAIEKLNQLLSEKTTKKCSSCGVKLADDFDFNICETCFSQRRRGRRPHGNRFREKKGGRSSGNKSKRSFTSSDNKDGSKSSKKSSSSSRRKNKSKNNKAKAFKRG